MNPEPKSVFFSHKTTEWYTPATFIEPVRRTLGGRVEDKNGKIVYKMPVKALR